MKLIYILSSLAAILSIGGCQHLAEKNPTLKAELTVFHEIPSDFKPSTIAIVPWHQSQKNSLEFKNYAAILKDRIEKLGFTVIDHQKKPELLLFFDYGDDNGKEMTETYSVPDFGMIGYTGYSMNSWSDMVIYDEQFLDEWLKSPQTSLYYALQVQENTQAKDDVGVELGGDFTSFFDLEEAIEEPLAAPDYCSRCAE